MRYAVVSDVHSNIDSLDVVFGMLREDDALLCLGDIVGYGPNPNECVEKIRARATATVLGNHDVAAIDNFGLAYFNPAAREAMKWTQSVLTAENLAWLDSLGYEFRMPDFLLVHGAPVNYFEYILDKAAAARAFAATDAPIIFIGHTHIAEVLHAAPGRRDRARAPAARRRGAARGGRAVPGQRRQRRPAARPQPARLVRVVRLDGANGDRYALRLSDRHASRRRSPRHTCPTRSPAGCSSDAERAKRRSARGAGTSKRLCCAAPSPCSSSRLCARLPLSAGNSRAESGAGPRRLRERRVHRRR